MPEECWHKASCGELTSVFSRCTHVTLGVFPPLAI